MKVSEFNLLSLDKYDVDNELYPMAFVKLVTYLSPQHTSIVRWIQSDKWVLWTCEE